MLTATEDKKAEFSPLGLDLFGEPMHQETNSPIARRFIMQPFSVMNAREGDWQERKRGWLSLGIQGEIGRDAKAFSCNDGQQKVYDYLPDIATGTSIFDPVLCEMVYRWFCPKGGQVIDPFAGGSVRGIVAHKLDRRYWGCDLRAEQIAANNEQGEKITPDNKPEWMCGDAMDAIQAAPQADFVFSCPPYGDLERYSDDRRDLSTMEYNTFMPAYKRIILRCFQTLKPNRFACFVVGDFRDKKTGNYRCFVADTINAFRECGFGFYNDAVLITAVGSLPIRITKQFAASRKMGKTHQNVLIFVKGDGKKAAKVVTACD